MNFLKNLFVLLTIPIVGMLGAWSIQGFGGAKDDSSYTIPKISSLTIVQHKESSSADSPKDYNEIEKENYLTTNGEDADEIIAKLEYRLSNLKNVSYKKLYDTASQINVAEWTESSKKERTKSVSNQQNQTHVTIVIDAFRAFTTASYVLERYPAVYLLTTASAIISRLALNLRNPLLIGKPEKGVEFSYDIPNSPTRVQSANITGRTVLHRTEAGAKGILLAQDADIVLAAGFANADATVQYIKTLKNPQITIAPMGHEATTPSLEDHVCAFYIGSLINGEKIALAPFLPVLKKGPGQYFFSEDQWQYPREDFELCLEIGRFDFAIQAVIWDDYAILTRCN